MDIKIGLFALKAISKIYENPYERDDDRIRNLIYLVNYTIKKACSILLIFQWWIYLKCIQSYNTISAILLGSCPCNCGVADCCGCFASAMDGNFAPECWLAEDTGNSLLLWLFSQPQPLLGHPWAQPQSCLLNPSIQPLAWDFC